MSEEAEDAIEWLLALFSNSYEQRSDMLGDLRGGMCCLGVANHVNSLGRNPGDSGLYLYPFEDKRVVERSYQHLIFVQEQEALVAMNDEAGLSHAEIAREILKDVQSYFPSCHTEILEFFTGGEDWRGWLS